MRIRLRLALGYAAVLAVTVGLVGVLVWWQLGLTLRVALETRLASELTDLLATVGQDGPEGIVEPDDQPDVVFVAVFDGAGRPLAAEPGMPADLVAPLPPRGVSERTLASGPYLLVVADAAGGTIAVAGAELRPIHDAQGSLIESVVVVASIASILSVLGGWWLAGRALAPVAALTAEAAAIGATDLDHRLHVSSHGDELSILARTLNDMLDRIDHSVQRQRSFLAAASHDLRTPVASLQAELELADREDADAAELLAAVRAARGDAVRLGDLAADLLELVSAGSGGRALARSTVPVAALVDAVIRHLTPIAADRGVTLSQEVDDATVHVDRVRIEQALRNIVANAITYSPSRGVVQVVATVGRDAVGALPMLAIDTLDRGPGIPEGERASILEPFGRGSGARGPGTGLGLSTALAAAHAHGGSLVIAARPGGGTVVSIRIPIDRPIP